MRGVQGSAISYILGLTSPVPPPPHSRCQLQTGGVRATQKGQVGPVVGRAALGPHPPCKTLTQLGSSITSVLGPQGSGGAQGALPLPGLPGPPCSGSPPSICLPVLPICLPVCTSVLLTVTPCPQTSGGRFQPGLLPASVSGGAYWGCVCWGTTDRVASTHTHPTSGLCVPVQAQEGWVLVCPSALDGTPLA